MSDTYQYALLVVPLTSNGPEAQIDVDRLMVALDDFGRDGWQFVHTLEGSPLRYLFQRQYS